MSFEDEIDQELYGIKVMLLAKNKAYGDAWAKPLRCFSRAGVAEQLLVRIDDKLSRLMRGQRTEDVPEDTVMDLIGYLVLLRVAQHRQSLAGGIASASNLAQEKS